ncbi:MAG: helix-turn-helix transcriptional regulator [Lachnospiraceae bacterium]|nr:helix-turn-helix transcriptional regulator [Lachnospiraceae bacterium]
MKQECLIELINSLGVKNFELADYCGLSAATIGRYIKGTRTPDLHSESTDKLIHGLVRCMEEHGKSNLFDEMAGTESENPYERLSAWLFENEPEKPKERNFKTLLSANGSPRQ